MNFLRQDKPRIYLYIQSAIDSGASFQLLFFNCLLSYSPLTEASFYQTMSQSRHQISTIHEFNLHPTLKCHTALESSLKPLVCLVSTKYKRVFNIRTALSDAKTYIHISGLIH